MSNTQADFSPGMAARTAALSVLSDVLRKRRPLDAALDEIVPRGLASRDVRFARAIASETMRRFGQLDALLRAFISKTPPPHRAGPTLEILLASACELLFLEVPAHAAVDGANRLAAADSKAVHFKPLINATLRRIARDGARIVADQDGDRLNTPDWLLARWCEFYGDDTARAIARAHAKTPPLDITMKASTGSEAFGTDTRMMPGDTARLGHAGPVDALPGFADGAWWVQDFAASLPVRLFGDIREKRVVDLCAAPGGKTAQLVAAGADVTAVEREPQRLARLKDNLERLHLSARLVEADVRDFAGTEQADFVLLDAPCSATGTIRRHPELPWIKSAADINVCINNAGELLDIASDMITPGGVLVFAVCSLEHEECAGQIDNFLRRHEDFNRDPVRPEEVFGVKEIVSADGDLRTLPCHFGDVGGMDGFYASRLRRSG